MRFLKTDCCRRQNVIVSLFHKLKGEEFFGEAAGIDEVELVDCAVFLNSRRRDWVDDFGNGVSRLEERVIACNENGRLDCVT